jgi:CheY-like chemotaxis protein
VFGDRERLQQIVWNLLSNGVKFTRRGGLVQVTLQRINSHIEIVVNDTGVGISPDFLPYVFERFRQADGSTTRNYGGLGLGLAIVRHLVELHGGTARAESAGQNEGSKFTIRLPAMNTDDDHPLPQEFKQPAIAEVETRDQRPTSLQGLRVLVVDDEIDARTLLTMMLEKCGAQVIAVGSSREGLESVETWKPDVLIADIGMPIEDGYGLIKKIRKLPKNKGGQVPALALTAYARTEDRVRALSEGYQVHLAKPVDRFELAAVVASLGHR